MPRKCQVIGTADERRYTQMLGAAMFSLHSSAFIRVYRRFLFSCIPLCSWRPWRLSLIQLNAADAHTTADKAAHTRRAPRPTAQELLPPSACTAQTSSSHTPSHTKTAPTPHRSRAAPAPTRSISSRNGTSTASHSSASVRRGWRSTSAASSTAGVSPVRLRIRSNSATCCGKPRIFHPRRRDELQQRGEHLPRVANQKRARELVDPLQLHLRQQMVSHLLLVEDLLLLRNRPGEPADDARQFGVVLGNRLLIPRMPSVGRHDEVVGVQRLVADGRVGPAPPRTHHRGGNVSRTRPHCQAKRHGS